MPGTPILKHEAMAWTNCKCIILGMTLTHDKGEDTTKLTLQSSKCSRTQQNDNDPS